MRSSLAFFTIMAGLLGASGVLAQNVPVVVQAESGTPGVAWTSPMQGTMQYVTVRPQPPGNAQNPALASRVITYSVTFPGPGTYDLYARVRVSSGAGTNDSFYYGNGFGTQNPADDSNWITCDNLSGAGYSAAGETVGGTGAGATWWQWLNLSRYPGGGEAPVSFVVPAGSLTQTFQIGGREYGLSIDQLAFGRAGLFFTVANLDQGQPGTTVPVALVVPMGRPIAAGQSKFLGSVFSPTQQPYFGVYWNQLTPENAGKWGSVEATRNVMNWTELDSAYALAQRQGIPFRLHTLVWGQQQPTWLSALPAADQLLELNQWMAALALRYPSIAFIDVVNEPLHAPPGNANPDAGNYLAALGGAGSTGYDWVITAFQMARRYFPSARLEVNEYGVEDSGPEARRYLALINLLAQRNLLDAVGIQAHAFSTRATSAATLTFNLNTLASAGKPLYITELDIDSNAALMPDDSVQLREYQRVFPALWAHPAVYGITLWGYRPGLWRTPQGAFIANADNTERLALQWLRGYVQSTMLGTAAGSALAPAPSLYPNPAPGGRIMLAGTSATTGLQVLDLTGRVVFALAGPLPPSIILPLPPGSYVLQLKSAAGLTSHKLLLE